MEIGNSQDLERAFAHVRGIGTYYININSGLRLHQVEDFGKFWLIEKKLSHLNWKIHEENRKIAGYTCKKATATVNLNSIRKGEITAWFATDLPFQFGPTGYGGLPGLILGLKMQDYYYYADNVQLNKKPNKIKKPAKGERISFEEYGQKSKELFKQSLKNRN